MISSKPLLNQIERWSSLNIKFVVQYLRQTTNNTVFVEDDSYYASYAVPMVDRDKAINRQLGFTCFITFFEANILLTLFAINAFISSND